MTESTKNENGMRDEPLLCSILKINALERFFPKRILLFAFVFFLCALMVIFVTKFCVGCTLTLYIRQSGICPYRKPSSV